MIHIQLFFQRLKLLPSFLYWIFKDLYSYFKNHRWDDFELFGMHIYVGKFGAGKTCSMVRDCYNICKKYKGVTILTNLKLVNFPDDVIIKPLNCIQDILNAPDKTVVLVDEIGTLFNSRDFANGGTKNGGGLPKILFQHICQCRHRHLVILGTVQRWGFLDKQLREITADVTVCSAFLPHPFSRMITNYVYDAVEYDLFYQSPMRPLVPLSGCVWIQSDFYRNLYDTKEMVSTMLAMDYVSDEEIERNRQFEALGIPVLSMEKKEERKLRSNIHKR